MVYRLLKEEDFRLWLVEQKDSVQEAYLNIIDGHFVRVFQDKDEGVAESAVVYAASLWSNAPTYVYGLRIANRLAKEIKPLSQMALSLVEGRGFRYEVADRHGFTVKCVSTALLRTWIRLLLTSRPEEPEVATVGQLLHCGQIL